MAPNRDVSYPDSELEEWHEPKRERQLCFPGAPSCCAQFCSPDERKNRKWHQPFLGDHLLLQMGVLTVLTEPKCQQEIL